MTWFRGERSSSAASPSNSLSLLSYESPGGFFRQRSEQRALRRRVGASSISIFAPGSLKIEERPDVSKHPIGSDEWEDEVLLRTPYMEFVARMGAVVLPLILFGTFNIVRTFTVTIPNPWVRWSITFAIVGVIWFFLLRLIQPMRQLLRYWRDEDAKATQARRTRRERDRVRHEREIQEERWRATEAKIKADAADRVLQRRTRKELAAQLEELD